MVKKHVPNFLTCCNLVSGCIATVMALRGYFGTAMAFIIIGAVFDFFDGMSARLLNVSSPIGKELDSLADCVTFGVAPSSMIFTLLSLLLIPQQLSGSIFFMYLPFIAYVMAAFSALRLAKFNLDERQTTSFIGLPTPANALMWASLICGFDLLSIDSPYTVWGVILLMLLCSYLLVCELPLFALKFKHWGWKGNEIKYIFLITCVPLLLFLREGAFAVIIPWYVILSVIGRKSAE